VSSANLKNVAIFVGLVALGLSTRFVPYVTTLESWNLNAVAAVALFAGFYFRNPVVALTAAALPMLLGDAVLSPYHSLEMVANYVGLLLPVLVGPVLRRRLNVTSVAAASLGSSAFFFLLSNAAYWWANLPHTWAALLKAYADGLPFYKGTIAGNLIFTLVLFGTYAIALQRGWLEDKEAQAAPVATG
jgi:hypothetical protein